MDFKKIAIITGGSKGIGAALVRTYVKHGFSVFSLSRTAAHPHPAVTSLLVDLSDPTDALNALNPLLKRISRLELSEIVFINNAGSLGDVAPIEKKHP